MRSPDWLITVLRLGIPAPLRPAFVDTRWQRIDLRRRWHASPPPPPEEEEPLDEEALQLQLALVCLACF